MPKEFNYIGGKKIWNTYGSLKLEGVNKLIKWDSIPRPTYGCSENHTTSIIKPVCRLPLPVSPHMELNKARSNFYGYVIFTLCQSDIMILQFIFLQIDYLKSDRQICFTINPLIIRDPSVNTIGVAGGKGEVIIFAQKPK